jgi:hypothetical protein
LAVRTAARPSRGSARRVVLAGAATLLVAGVLAVAGSGMPPADEGSAYGSAIVALELARSPAEVARVLGPAPAHARAVLERVVWIDFGFLLVYPALQLAIVYFLTRRRAWRALAAALALAMLGGDALENRALLGLLAAAPDGAAALVASVELWTTVKWSALFAAALLTGGLLFARGGAQRALALLPLASGVAGLVGLAWVERRPLVEVAGIYGIGATWVMLIGMALLGLKASRTR